MFYFTTQQRISRNITFTDSQLQWFTRTSVHKRKCPQCGVRLVQGLYLVVLVNNEQPKTRINIHPRLLLYPLRPWILVNLSLDPMNKTIGGSKNTNESRGASSSECSWEQIQQTRLIRFNTQPSTNVHTIQILQKHIYLDFNYHQESRHRHMFSIYTYIYI